MSTNLYVSIRKPKGKTLPTALKWVLQKRFGNPVNAILTRENIPYLQGLVDTNVYGSADLLRMLEKHDEVIIKEEE